MTEWITGSLRASDLDREGAVADLRDAYALGRLTAEEFQWRADLAERSSTVQQLCTVTADIPRRPAAATPGTPMAQWSPMAPTAPMALPAALPVPSGPPAYYYPPFPSPAPYFAPIPARGKTNPTAVVALVLSVVGFLTFRELVVSVLASVLAVLALRQIDKADDADGRGCAVAALAISAGSVCLALELLQHWHT